MSTPAGVIPYVEHHDGPKRILTLALTSNAAIKGTVPPVVGLDGRQYVVYWGTIGFEIPADRACHVSVHVVGEHMGQHASVLLNPGADVSLTYETNWSSGIGTLR